MQKVFSLILFLIILIHISFGQKPELVIHTGHLSAVEEIWINSDENVLISRSNEKLIFWELKNQRILREISNVKEFYESPNDKTVVTIDKDFNKLDIWDAETANYLSSILNFNDWSYSLNGEKIVTAHSNGILGFWSSKEKEPQYIKLPTEIILRNCLFGLGDRFVFFSTDENNGSLYFINLNNNLYYKFAENISYWSLTPDGKYLILQDRNNRLEALELYSDSNILHKKQVFAQEGVDPRRMSGTSSWTVSPNGKYLVFWDRDGFANFVEFTTGRIKLKILCGLNFSGTIFADTEGLIFSRTGNMVYRENSNGIYDIDKEKRMPEIKSEGYYNTALSLDGNLLFSFVASPKSSVIWDVINGKSLFSIKEEPDYKFDKALFSQEENILATIKFKPSNYSWTKDYKISVTDLTSGKERNLYEYKHEKKDSQFNVYGYGAEYGVGWGVGGGATSKDGITPIILIKSKKKPEKSNVLFMSKGKSLVVGEQNGKISICDTETGARTILRSETVLRQGFFSEDGKGINLYIDIENYNFLEFSSGAISKTAKGLMTYKKRDELFDAINDKGIYTLKNNKTGETVIQIDKISYCESDSKYKNVLCKSETAEKDVFQVDVWNIDTKKITFSKTAKDPFIQISDDEKYLSLYSRSENGFLAEVWDIANKELKISVDKTGLGKKSWGFFSEDNKIAGIRNVISSDSLRFDVEEKYTVEFWNIEESRRIFFAENVYYDQFSSDGSEMIFIAEDKLQTFNLKTYKTAGIELNASNNLVSFLGGMFYSRFNKANNKVVFFTSPNDRYESGIVFLWNIAGNKIFTLNGHSSMITAAEFSIDDRFLLTSNTDGTIKLWNTDNGNLLLTFIFTNERDWLVTTPEGFFDGTPNAWKQILWRFDNNAFNYAPVEAFFKELYYPGLLQEIMQGKTPTPPAKDLSEIDIRQPAVKITGIDGKPVNPANNLSAEKQTVKVRVEIEDNSQTGRRPDFPASSGANDLRLFRNGSLVRLWKKRGAASDKTSSVFDLGKDDGCTQIAATKDAPRKAVCETEAAIISGANDFTAYAFNTQDVKSTDAPTVSVEGRFPKRDGTLYVLAIGVNDYAPIGKPNGMRGLDLDFAVPDVVEIGEKIKEQQAKISQDAALKQYARTEIITLKDQTATKDNILLALSRFARPGESTDARTKPLPENSCRNLPENLCAGLKQELLKIKPTAPEDALIVYYAGHGVSKDRRFFLLPHNYRTRAGADDLPEQSVSDLDLNEYLEKVDAGKLLMVIDACQSGQALGEKSDGRAPMNSKGLAQLAYDKGMLILTAAQSFQAALEAPRIGDKKIEHGLLTYALLEALKAESADKDGNKRLWEREWFDFATEQVPLLQMEAMRQRRIDLQTGKPETKGRSDIIYLGGDDPNADPERRRVQTPRVFYRREAETKPLVMAIP